MKILMMTNTYTPIVGGVERSIELFTESFWAKGHDVLIVTPEFDGVPKKEKGIVRIPALRNFNGSDFSVRLPVPIDLFVELDKFKPDIIHSHHPFLLGDTALRIANRYKTPLVFTHHTKYEDYTHYVPMDSPGMKKFVIELSTGYANLCDHVFAPSQSIKDLIISRGVKTPVDVVATGIDLDKFAKSDVPAFRKKWKIDQDDFLVGHLGRIAPEKNIDFLSKAVLLFLKGNPKAKYMVVGYGPSLDKIKKQFAAQNISQQLIVTGKLGGQELIDAFHAMDVFAFASKTETQGVVLMESFASSTPIVALKATGVVDVLKDGVNGLMLENESADEFAAALKKMQGLTSKEMDAFKRKALESMKEYSIDATSEKALSIYKKIHHKDFLYPDFDSTPWVKAIDKIRTEWGLLKNFTDSASAAFSNDNSKLESGDSVKPRLKRKRQHLDKLIAINYYRFRRWINRNEWAANLLGLSKSFGNDSNPGLVMIQIDGFSLKQFKNAIAEGKMPNIRKIMMKENYKLYPLYTGLPSSTPAVQGELFYGVRQAVPAFAFLDKKSNKVFKMYHGPDAGVIEARLAEQGEGLLTSGSSYSNVYTGGANEAHFCGSSLGLNKIWRDVNPWKMVFFIASHFISFIRIVILLAVEILWGCLSLLWGLIIGQNVGKELKFVPTRALICVLLRELITIGAKIDISRGLEIIHLNFLGYDEQAHRRGPSSKFAHQALWGIDSAVGSIFKAALRAQRRNYDVWIYSDHGQEDVESYWTKYGKPVRKSIAEVFEEFTLNEESSVYDDERGIADQRLEYFGVRVLNKFFPGKLSYEKKEVAHELVVTAIGPTGNIYLPKRFELKQKFAFAEQLVKSAHIPMVLVPLGFAQAKAFTEKGEFTLPEQARNVLGDHPFLDEVTQDLIDLCHHAEAGDFTFSGWRPGEKPMSFPIESGAHAGPGGNETHPFALLPADILLMSRQDGSIRTGDLRQAAMRFLNRLRDQPPEPITTVVKKKEETFKTLRVMTYNVHSCVGFDGKISPERIARVIGRYEPDIVALQELDLNRPRTRRMDQPHLIAQKLEMSYHFHPSFQIEEENYGNAILSRYPMKLIYAGALPGLKNKPKIEKRGALWGSINIGGVEVQFINTHLGLKQAERRYQIEELLSETWLKHPECVEPIIFCGDLNAFPNTFVYKQIGTRLRDAQKELEAHKPKATFFSPYPLGRLDHIFISPDIKILSVHVPQTSLDKIASDHLPLIVDLKIKIKQDAEEPAINADKADAG